MKILLTKNVIVIHQIIVNFTNYLSSVTQMSKKITSAIEFYTKLGGNSEYFLSPINWSDVKRIYYAGDEGLLVTKEYQDYVDIWLLKYKDTNTIFQLFSNLAKDEHKNKTYILLSEQNLAKWLVLMGFTEKDGIYLYIEGDRLKNNFLNLTSC